MMKNRLAVRSIALALVGLNACSDSPVAPSAGSPFATKPSFVINASPITPVAGQVWVCKVWLGTPGTNPSVATTPIPSPARATLTINAASIPSLGSTCVRVATSTASSVDGFPDWTEDQVRVVETPGSGSHFVSGKVFFSGDAANPAPPPVSFASTTRDQIFNNFHGAVIVFENELDAVEEVCDRYTFGGWVNQKPNHISYGVNAGLNSAGLAWGDFEINNHANGDKIHVWNVTAYGVPASGVLAGVENARFASGPAEVNGEAGHTAELRFVDNGEPGTDDRIWLAVDGSQYFPLQNVQGGNIQLHDQCKKAPKAEKH